MSLLHGEGEIRSLSGELDALTDPKKRLAIGKRIKKIEDEQERLRLKAERKRAQELQGPNFLQALFGFGKVE
ncbi:MAG: hypothetical protein WC880_02115 [Candidatus Paceibacterota bacterium]